MKHTQIPEEFNNWTRARLLAHGDKLVYACIRRFMDASTRMAYPSVGYICKKLQCSRTKIVNAIDRLRIRGLLEVKVGSTGKANYYYLPETEFDAHFQRFTDDFLDMDLPLNLKEYYMDIQQLLKIDPQSGVGTTWYSNAEISRRTGWSQATVGEYNKELIIRGLLKETLMEDTTYNGFPVVEKSFDLEGLNQLQLWAEKITKATVKNASDIEKTNKRVELLEAQVTELIEQLAKKESEEKVREDARQKIEAIKRNTTINVVYPME